MAIPEIKTILYTTSLGKHTRPVARQAAAMAAAYKAKIVMLHVIEPLGDTGMALLEGYVSHEQIKTAHDEGLERVKENMKERIINFYNEEMQGLAQIEMDYQIAEGHRSDQIVDAANKVGADLIIMGSHNSLGRSSRTTRQVIKYSARPVLVVPTHNK